MRTTPLTLTAVLLLALTPAPAQTPPAAEPVPIADSDGDGVGDACGLCPRVPVKDGEHADADTDGVGDECDNRRLPNPRDERGEQAPCPEAESYSEWKDPNPLGRRLQVLIRPLALGYRYRGSWVGSTGLGLHLGARWARGASTRRARP